MADDDPPHVRLRASSCPHCGYRLDAAGKLTGPVGLPKAGDLSVCFGCGEVLTFDRRLRLVRITAAELAALDVEEMADLRAVQATIRAFLRGEA